MMQNYIEHTAWRDGKAIYIREYPGVEPACVLMHGFPDSLELYDKLVPYLTENRRVVVFDFIGWGKSDKSAENDYTFENLKADLDAVINHLELESPDLVAHDASGPPAIEWAIENPSRVGNLILLNIFYMMMLRLRPPEGVFLYMMPGMKYFFRWLNRLSKDRMNYYIYHWQLRRFVREPDVKREFIPYLYRHWQTSWPGFRDLVGSLFFYSISRASKDSLDRLRQYKGRVRIIFGAKDPYLNVHVARKLHRLYQNSDLFLLPDAYHYVQVDEPKRVAELILELRPAHQNVEIAPAKQFAWSKQA